jgi:hypothetical protein
MADVRKPLTRAQRAAKQKKREKQIRKAHKKGNNKPTTQSKNKGKGSKAKPTEFKIRPGDSGRAARNDKSAKTRATNKAKAIRAAKASGSKGAAARILAAAGVPGAVAAGLLSTMVFTANKLKDTNKNEKTTKATVLRDQKAKKARNAPTPMDKFLGLFKGDGKVGSATDTSPKAKASGKKVRMYSKPNVRKPGAALIKRVTKTPPKKAVTRGVRNANPDKLPKGVASKPASKSNKPASTGPAPGSTIKTPPRKPLTKKQIKDASNAARNKGKGNSGGAAKPATSAAKKATGGKAYDDYNYTPKKKTAPKPIKPKKPVAAKPKKPSAKLAALKPRIKPIQKAAEVKVRKTPPGLTKTVGPKKKVTPAKKKGYTYNVSQEVAKKHGLKGQKINSSDDRFHNIYKEDLDQELREAQEYRDMD